MSRNIFCTIFWTTVLSFSTVIAAESTFTSFDYPGANVTAPQGINASGAVVGAYVDSAGKQHAFLLDSGTFTSKPTLRSKPRSSSVRIGFAVSVGDIRGCMLNLLMFNGLRPETRRAQ